MASGADLGVSPQRGSEFEAQFGSRTRQKEFSTAERGPKAHFAFVRQLPRPFAQQRCTGDSKLGTDHYNRSRRLAMPRFGQKYLR